MAMSPALTGTALAVSVPARLARGCTAWRQQQMQSPHRVLHARGLVITDGNGQARVVPGAPLDVPARVESVTRAVRFSCLTLLVPEGGQRGGYATSDPHR